MPALRTLRVSPDGGERRMRWRGYHRVLAGLLLASIFGGCGGGGGVAGGPVTAGAAGSAAPASSTPPTASAWAGHFVGTVTVAGQALFGDAILTADGSVRLYAGGPYTNGGALQKTVPTRSEQLVGSLNVSEDYARAAGTGVIMGQQCASAAHSPFCDEPASADISMSLAPGNVAGVSVRDIEGQIQVATSAGSETWSLHLDPWSGDEPLSPWKGQLKELLAEFASGGDTVIVVDDTGAMFFQSAHSGCVGKGMLKPGTDGVTLTLDNCNGAFAYLNGDYSGLATVTQSTVWDYDGLLRAWLSKAPGAANPAALTMLADPL